MGELSSGEEWMERRGVVLSVRDLMMKHLISIDVKENIMKVAQLMDEKGISSGLVRDAEEFVGIITDQDIISRVVSKGLDPGKVSSIEVMSSPLITINADASIEKLLKRCEKIRSYEERGKATTIIVAAEGIGDTSKVVEHIRQHTHYEVRHTKLGHVQRGGSPTARGRLIADLFGIRAVESLLNGAKSKMVGLEGKSVVFKDLEYVCRTRKPIDKILYKLAEELAV